MISWRTEYGQYLASFHTHAKKVGALNLLRPAGDKVHCCGKGNALVHTKMSSTVLKKPTFQVVGDHHIALPPGQGGLLVGPAGV
eukprot:515347-Pelagomonas_calceolata.AAC.2